MPETPLLPDYYLVHTTPEGPRYAYPVPPVPQEAAWAGAKSEAWGTDDTAAVTHRIERSRAGYSTAATFEWIVSDRPLDRLVLRWTSSGGMSTEWRKVAELSTTDSVIVRAWEAAPDAPTVDDRAHLALGSDHDEDNCLTCAVIFRVYERVPLPRINHERVHDLSAWRPLPGTPDPAPGRPWTVADPSVLKVYGRHTGHLWPGYMSGFRQAVVEELYRHPLVAAINPPRGGFDHTVYHSEREGKVSVNIPIRWNVPQSRAKQKGDRGRGPFVTVQATTHRVELAVPDNLRASDKATALTSWDDVVGTWVAKFLPDVESLQACSSCSGRGFHMTPAGAS